jgi:MFS family permease
MRLRFPGIDDQARCNVRRVSIAKLISQAGSGAAWIALVAIVYDRTDGSGLWLAAALVGSFAVRALAGPWVGALGDRFDRRTVMVSSDLAAAAAFVGLAFADEPIVLVLLAAVAALAEAPFGPAANAQLVMLVPEEQRAWATATRSAAIGAGLVIGGVVGGALVAAFGAPATFLVNAVSFVVSAALVLRVTGGPYRAEPSVEPAHEGVWAGVRIVAGERALRLTAASVGLGLLGTGMMNTAEYPLFVQLGSGSFAFGISVAGWGLGLVLGARRARNCHDAAAERRLLIAGMALVGVGQLLSGLIPVVAIVVVLFTMAGVGYGASNAASTLVMQRWAPDAVRARVFGAVDSVYSTAIGIAMASAGVLLALLGARGVFVLGGLIALAGVVVAERMPPRRERHDEAPAADRVVTETGPRLLPLASN